MKENIMNMWDMIWICYGETFEEYCKDKNKIFNNKYYCFFLCIMVDIQDQNTYQEKANNYNMPNGNRNIICVI